MRLTYDTQPNAVFERPRCDAGPRYSAGPHHLCDWSQADGRAGPSLTGIALLVFVHRCVSFGVPDPPKRRIEEPDFGSNLCGAFQLLLWKYLTRGRAILSVRRI